MCVDIYTKAFTGPVKRVHACGFINSFDPKRLFVLCRAYAQKERLLPNSGGGPNTLSTNTKAAAVSSATNERISDPMGQSCPPGRQEDVWCQRDGFLVRVHVKPRRKLFTPNCAPGRPVPMSRLMDLRVTTAKGRERVVRGSWKGPGRSS